MASTCLQSAPQQEQAKESLFSVSLQGFLTQQKKHVLLPQQQTQHWVIGNEAGDADSIISAIALAYIESTTTTTTTESTETPQDVRKTPIVSISQSDLQSQRPETTLLLQQWAQIELDSLWYVDQLEELLSLSSSSNDKQFDSATISVDLTLVDHNSLNTAILPRTLLQNEKDYSWKVVDILDHHLDEGQHTDTCPSLPTTITTVQLTIGSSSNKNQRRTIAFENGVSAAASTCTLIVERLQEIMGFTTPPPPQQRCLPASLSILLLGTILLDSVNMLPQAGKGTPRDAAAISFLQQHTRWEELPESAARILLRNNDDDDADDTNRQSQQQPDQTLLFNALQSAKFDLRFWKSLSVRDALRLDYKQFIASEGTIFGVSTVLVSLSDFMEKSNIQTNILKYMQEVNVNFLGVMLTFVDKTEVASASSAGSDMETDTHHHHRRQLVLCSRNGFPLQQLVDFLTNNSKTGKTNPPLRLSELSTGNLDRGDGDDNDTGAIAIRYFDQGNTKASRKQVAPVFFQFFENRP